ncbi:MAG TPA: cell division protein FtsQ/DivIB [Gammaproteobacteria bacterium]|nr:cell division protein FtsQ/DivIB [Gammaproteobacteria bacterium]
MAEYFPIKTVRVYGVQHISNQEVKDLLLPLVKHGFFAVDVEHIKERLLHIPWVADIFVRRHWPDVVEVTIVEKNAIAKWNKTSLLSDTGVVFSPRQHTYPNGLPQLNGPEGKQVLMLQHFNEMNRLLAPLRAKIFSLELTPFLTWKLTLNNGVAMQIGHKDILTRLDHFVRVYPKIVGSRAADVEYVDLRYPSGVAVRWKPTIKT